MIRFEKSDSNTYVEIVVRDSDDTWMQVTDEFIHFLQACGYIVEGIDVADYLEEQYGFQRKEKLCQDTMEKKTKSKKLCTSSKKGNYTPVLKKGRK